MRGPVLFRGGKGSLDLSQGPFLWFWSVSRRGYDEGIGVYVRGLVAISVSWLV